jgi:cell division protein FtsL
MIRELYQRLSLKYQIWKTGREILQINRDESYLESEVLDLSLPLRIKKASLISKKSVLENKLYNVGK